jgi:hypothetical protein
MRFLDRMRGALTAAPTKELPVNQMPQAAPTTLNPNPKATPKLAKPYGDMCVNTSDQPALQNSLVQILPDWTMVIIGCGVFFSGGVLWAMRLGRDRGMRAGHRSFGRGKALETRVKGHELVRRMTVKPQFETIGRIFAETVGNQALPLSLPFVSLLIDGRKTLIGA